MAREHAAHSKVYYARPVRSPPTKWPPRPRDWSKEAPSRQGASAFAVSALAVPPQKRGAFMAGFF